MLANKTHEGHAYDAKITDAATQPADPAEDAPVSNPNAAEALPAAKPTIGLSIRKRPHSHMTGTQLQHYPQQPPINDRSATDRNANSHAGHAPRVASYASDVAAFPSVA